MPTPKLRPHASLASGLIALALLSACDAADGPGPSDDDEDPPDDPPPQDSGTTQDTGTPPPTDAGGD